MDTPPTPPLILPSPLSSTPQPSPQPSPIQSLQSPPTHNGPKVSSRRPRRPHPSTSLPAVRLLISPQPGVGIDIRLPYSKPVRLFVSLEAYLNGHSHVRLGLEMNKFPFIRLEAVPHPCISFRPSPIRLGDLKFLVAGISIPLSSSRRPNEYNFRRLLPVIEIQHRYTLLGSAIDPKQRKKIVDLMDAQRDGSLPDKIKERLNIGSKASLPPLDWRREGMEDRERASKITDDIVDNILKKGMGKEIGDSKFWPGAVKDGNIDDGLGFKQNGEDIGDGKGRIFGESPTKDAIDKAAKAAMSERKGMSVLGQMKPGRDGKFKLVTPGDGSRGSLEGSKRADEVGDAINDMMDDHPLLIFGRSMMMRFREIGDNRKK